MLCFTYTVNSITQSFLNACWHIIIIIIIIIMYDSITLTIKLMFVTLMTGNDIRNTMMMNNDDDKTFS
jgi:hypothetical protein